MRRRKALRVAENSDDEDDMGAAANFNSRNRGGTPGNLSFKETSVAGYSRASGSKLAGMGA